MWGTLRVTNNSLYCTMASVWRNNILFKHEVKILNVLQNIFCLPESFKCVNYNHNFFVISNFLILYDSFYNTPNCMNQCGLEIIKKNCHWARENLKMKQQNHSQLLLPQFSYWYVTKDFLSQSFKFSPALNNEAKKGSRQRTRN